jgi:hypothetical protein
MNLLHVFRVVSLTWVIMLWLGPITKNGGGTISHLCFLDYSNITYIDAHLVKAIKFPMILGNHHVKRNDLIYKLLMEHKSMICVALSEDD